MKKNATTNESASILSGLKGRDLTKITDLNQAEAEAIIERALSFQNAHQRGVRREQILNGHVVAMIFEKPSLRTKVAFEVAATYLGGTPVFLSSSQILASGNNQRGRESVPDIARNLERFGDLIIARVYSHAVIEEMAESIQIPVVNALCDRHHPTQALADLMTLKLFLKRPPQDTTVAFVGDGNNVATSLMQICALCGYNFRIASPAGYSIPRGEAQIARVMAKRHGTEVAILEDPVAAVKGAHVVYADTFTSMGQEGEKGKRDLAFAPYQVNSKLMKAAARDALFMHCLPAHRGEEVTDEVMDSKQSVVFDQAECRLHVAKSLLSLFLTGI